MKLKPGFEVEYKKRHDEIWPKLSQVLKEAGATKVNGCLNRHYGSTVQSSEKPDGRVLYIGKQN